MGVDRTLAPHLVEQLKSKRCTSSIPCTTRYSAPAAIACRANSTWLSDGFPFGRFTARNHGFPFLMRMMSDTPVMLYFGMARNVPRVLSKMGVVLLRQKKCRLMARVIADGALDFGLLHACLKYCRTRVIVSVGTRSRTKSAL